MTVSRQLALGIGIDHRADMGGGILRVADDEFAGAELALGALPPAMADDSSWTFDSAIVLEKLLVAPMLLL